jgi:NADH-quinone oxidoreductase subunit C
MTNEEIKLSVSALFPTAVFEETGQFLNILVASHELKPLMKALRSKAEFSFDYLFCLTCVDWKTHLSMVYHLLSREHKHAVVVKAKIADCNSPAIDTVCDIWKTANFHEREVYDLFGVKFLNHPDLRRILLDEDWKGFPLRKNYVDENMIEL